MLTDDGEIEIAVPRDRNGSFEPQIVAKGQTRLDGFDDQIISLYARGLSVREIQGHLQELYGVEVSPDLISRVTDAVLEEVREWQNRPLDPVYPVVFFDALRVKIRDEGLVKNKAVYVALGAQPRRREGGARAVDRADRGRQVLVEGDERAQDPRRQRHPDRGRRRAQGLSRGDRPVFPQTTVQTCIIHLIRNCLAFVSWKDRKRHHARSARRSTGPKPPRWRCRLDDFEAEWGKRYPAIGQAWRRAWEHVVPLFAFPPAIRKMIYTTNAVESLNRSLRKIIKTRGSFPTDDAALKLLFLAIRNAGVHWKPAIEWRAAYAQFTIFFAERLPTTIR